MIKGIGVDVVDVNRFMASLSRVPALRERLFTASERDLPPASLAARFAAKEAIAKALGSPGGMSWQDCTIHRRMHAPPRVDTRGTVLAAANARGVRTWHLSISHDAGIATALAIAEG